MIKIGYNSVGIIDKRRDRTIIQILKGGKLICNGKVNIGADSNISIGTTGTIEFAGDDIITARSTLISHKKIYIGKDVLISWDCLFMDTDFHKIVKNDKIINTPIEIIIRNHVWFGCRCKMSA